jgi:hypothetical protein
VRVLVSGDREWSDRALLYSILDEVNSPDDPIEVIIEGEARGADLMGRRWAEEHGIPFEPYPARWAEHGRKKAGPLRNTQMLYSGKPDLVVAFHDDLTKSRGTADMVRQARKEGVAVYVVGHRTRHHTPARAIEE